MTQANAPFRVIQQEGGLVAGPMRWPRNLLADRKGSVYEDSTAQELGLRGGTVGAPLHMEQFPPLLTHLFGLDWWRRGNLSLYFRYATTDREGVQCFAVAPERDSDGGVMRSEVWIDHEDGHRVADGTAAVGNPDMRSALRRRLEHIPKPGNLRILEHMRVGHEVTEIATRVDADVHHQRLEEIVEPLAAYASDDEWGAPILPPGLVFNSLLRASTKLLDPEREYGVGLFGAIELQFFDGPMFPEMDYVTRCRVVAVSETPKTEYAWVETVTSDPLSGNDVVGMLMMMRWLKAAHPLWAEPAESETRSG